jgi:hypothetical protein
MVILIDRHEVDPAEKLVSERAVCCELLTKKRRELQRFG